MLFIIDRKLPVEAKNSLSIYGEVIELETLNLTNEYLTGHPDIFFCKTPDVLICAPNLPQMYFDILNKNNIKFIAGNKPVSKGYPDCALYNVVVTDDYVIHKIDITEKSILEYSPSKQIIKIPQGFTRCNLVEIKPNVFITSDKSIFNSLKSYAEILFVDPVDIKLPGVKYGFFGGTCGVYENKLFICGSLSKYADGFKVKDFLNKYEIEIIELYDAPLFDGGSILIL